MTNDEVLLTAQFLFPFEVTVVRIIVMKVTLTPVQDKVVNVASM